MAIETHAKVVVGMVDRLTAPLRKTRQKLEETTRKIQKIDAFDGLKKNAAETANALRKTRQSLAETARAMKGGGTATATLKKELDKGKSSALRLKEQLRGDETALHSLRGALRAARVDTSKMGASLAVLKARSRSLGSALKKQDIRMNASRRALQRFRGAARAAGSTLKWLAGISAAGFFGIKNFADTAGQFEKFRVQLEALEGSAAKAERSMSWVKEFAKKTPFEVETVVGAFAKLKTFGLDPMDGTLQAITDQTAKLGGGQMEMEGIIMAVGQAWSKQKLQGEEALQLIERGVPVWDLLSTATGKSAVELQELSSKGKLGRNSIALLVKEMGKASAGASAKQMETYNGLISNLSDSWVQFKLEVMKAGAFDAIKRVISEFSSWLTQLKSSGATKLLSSMFTGFIYAARAATAVGGAVFRIIGYIGKRVRTVVDFITTPLQWLFEALSLVLDKAAELARLKDGFGRIAASVMAGLGSSAAAEALESDVNARYGSSSGRGGWPPLVRQPPAAPVPVAATVGGTLNIKIDTAGNASVESMESQGGMEFDVEYTGAGLGAGAY